jgi:hypothetical protein
MVEFPLANTPHTFSAAIVDSAVAYANGNFPDWLGLWLPLKKQGEQFLNK